jgi:hypothetical protein
VPEEVAVMHTRAPAELAHRVAELRSNQRVYHHRRPPARLLDGDVEILDVLDPRVANLLERLIRELRLECEHEALSRLARRVRDDVELDRDTAFVAVVHEEGG